jgi:DNA polymerase-4
VILHADMDAFYASIEQLDDPALRGRPVIVGGLSGRGVVSTASYEARRFGVHSAMPMAWARRRCPNGVYVWPRFDRYQAVSATVMGVFARFSPAVEPLSLDEAFLDLHGAERLLGPPEAIGRALKDAVREATGGLTVSVGIANTKYVAKVASDVRKPDGLTIVRPDEVRAFLDPLPVSRLWGAGPRTVERLQALGLSTIGEVARADPRRLTEALGSMGDHLYRLANNDDPRPVVAEREAKSIGSENTLERDVSGPAAIRPHLRRAADEVGRRLRSAGVTASGVRVKLKTASFRLLTRQARLPAPTDVADALFATAETLLTHFDLTEPVRLIGLAAFDLGTEPAPAQLDLFAAPADAPRRRRLEATLDQVRARFGPGALHRADDIGDE